MESNSWLWEGDKSHPHWRNGKWRMSYKQKGITKGLVLRSMGKLAEKHLLPYVQVIHKTQWLGWEHNLWWLPCSLSLLPGMGDGERSWMMLESEAAFGICSYNLNQFYFKWIDNILLTKFEKSYPLYTVDITMSGSSDHYYPSFGVMSVLAEGQFYTF